MYSIERGTRRVKRQRHKAARRHKQLIMAWPAATFRFVSSDRFSSGSPASTVERNGHFGDVATCSAECNRLSVAVRGQQQVCREARPIGPDPDLRRLGDTGNAAANSASRLVPGAENVSGRIPDVAVQFETIAVAGAAQALLQTAAAATEG